MRVLVISDTHGFHDNFEKIVDLYAPVDMVIHAGDVCGEETYFENALTCPVVMVKGNCDSGRLLQSSGLIEAEGHRIFVVHGHNYEVNGGPWNLTDYAYRQGADIAVYGHTHVPAVSYDEDFKVWAVNPGSLTSPRQYGGKPSYLIMELEKEAEPAFKIHYLES